MRAEGGSEELKQVGCCRCIRCPLLFAEPMFRRARTKGWMSPGSFAAASRGLRRRKCTIFWRTLDFCRSAGPLISYNWWFTFIGDALNILLVNPEVPDTFWSYTHAIRMIRKKALSPPLGLLTVAAMLPPDWGKKLIDLNVTSLSDQDLAWADYVFISGMAVQRQAAFKVIARCKAADKRVVAGGPLFTGEYALFEQVDHFVLNEAELTIGDMVSGLEQGTAKRVYRTREFADLRTSPTPLWELADLDQYACACVQFSRGCPYDCEFCNVTQMLGRNPRVKTGAQIITELESLHARGWRRPVFFVDDNLIGNRPALKNDLLPALIEWQKRRGPIPFFTQASVNLADDTNLMKNMVQAGFDMVFVGIETPDDQVLAACGKSQNRKRDLIGDVKRMQRAGLEVQAGFIVGFDQDTPSIFRRQVEFIRQSGIVTAMVGMLHAPPGTQLAQRLWREGRLLGPSSGDNTDGTTNIRPKMGLQSLREGYRWILDQLYAPRPYYQRIKAFLREYRPPGTRSPMNLSSMRAFLRSVYHLGIVGQERFEYWMLLLWTLLHRPSLLPAAVRLAICGNHYRRMSELLDVSAINPGPAIATISVSNLIAPPVPV